MTISDRSFISFARNRQILVLVQVILADALRIDLMKEALCKQTV